MNATSTTKVDIIIVGAGLSGINAAYRLKKSLPDATMAILERRERVGGTWDLFTYPGIRSDSDIFTLSYPFRAWEGTKTMAGGAEIRQYIETVAQESGIDKLIDFSTQVHAADWDSAEKFWKVTATKAGVPHSYSSQFIFFCTGYYNYDAGFCPDFSGIDNFSGQLVHPQQWPKDLDYQGKKVVVIGSGATAITLIPSMADKAEHITMLQRSPTYIVPVPSSDPLTVVVQKILSKSMAHNVIRWRNAIVTLGFYQYCRRVPQGSRKFIQRINKSFLPKGYNVDLDFKPSYNPWDQRLCVVPNGDLFKAISAGKASVVTDHIERFTPTGILLKSGKEISADIVVTATGLELQALGGIKVSIDDKQIDVSEKYLYKGYALQGVPNLFWTIGYTNASWTLRADLTSRAVARLVAHMKKRGYETVTPTPGDRKLVGNAGFGELQSSYVLRSVDQLPLSGQERPWAVRQNFILDFIDFKRDRLDQDVTFN